jgi:hypothetical protein
VNLRKEAAAAPGVPALAEKQKTPAAQSICAAKIAVSFPPVQCLIDILYIVYEETGLESRRNPEVIEK